MPMSGRNIGTLQHIVHLIWASGILCLQRAVGKRPDAVPQASRNK
jgi:hypothetical protein